MLDVSAYLDRIGYLGPIEATAGNLRALHRAHLLTVPFENLDISLGREIVLEEEAILRKILELRRGGFCYELNSAFAALLRALGFHVTLLSARVARSDGGGGPGVDHLTLRVDLEEPWLADVGFGNSFLEPLRFATGFEQLQGGRKYRMVDENGSLHIERTELEDRWRRQYSFTLTPRRLDEFAALRLYHQTSPES